MDMTQFKHDLAKALENTGHTQAELSKLSGVPQSTISLFLSGSRKGMTGDSMLKLWPFVYGQHPPAKPPAPDQEAQSLPPRERGLKRIDLDDMRVE